MIFYCTFHWLLWWVNFSVSANLNVFVHFSGQVYPFDFINSFCFGFLIVHPGKWMSKERAVDIFILEENPKWWHYQSSNFDIIRVQTFDPITHHSFAEPPDSEWSVQNPWSCSILKVANHEYKVIMLWWKTTLRAPPIFTKICHII